MKLMRQVSITSLGDDARVTLTIAGLEKAKKRALEQHLRLRAPQIWTVLRASVDQYLRTTVDSGSQPTPNGNWCRDVNVCLLWQSWTRESEVSMPKCQAKQLGKTGHLSVMCRQREKSAASRVHGAAVERVLATAARAVVVDRSVIDDHLAFVETKIAASVVSVVI